MADRIPLILNTTVKRIEQVQSSDTVYVPKDLSVYSDIRSAHIDDSNALNTGYYARTDFTTNGILGGFFTSSVLNSGTISISTVNPSSHNGCTNYLVLSGNSVNCNPRLKGNHIYINTEFAEYEFCCRVCFSNTSNNFLISIGLINDSNTDYVIFHTNTETSNTWRSYTTINGVQTSTNTSQNISTSWQKLYFKIDRNNNAPRVRFYINNSLVSTHTTNIPNTCGVSAFYTQSDSTTREFRIDYAYLKITYLSRQTRF